MHEIVLSRHGESIWNQWSTSWTTIQAAMQARAKPA